MADQNVITYELETSSSAFAQRTGHKYQTPTNTTAEHEHDASGVLQMSTEMNIAQDCPIQDPPPLKEENLKRHNASWSETESTIMGDVWPIRYPRFEDRSDVASSVTFSGLIGGAETSPVVNPSTIEDALFDLQPRLPRRRMSWSTLSTADENNIKCCHDCPPVRPGRQGSISHLDGLQTLDAFDASNETRGDHVPRMPPRPRRLSYHRSEDITEYALLFFDIVKKLVRTRTYRLRKYKNVFVGNEVVDTLLTAGVVNTRQEAVEMGRRLGQHGLFHHVCWDHDFKDRYLFYRFCCDERSDADHGSTGSAGGGLIKEPFHSSMSSAFQSDPIIAPIEEDVPLCEEVSRRLHIFKK